MGEEAFESVTFVVACAAVPRAGLALFRGQPYRFEPVEFLWWAQRLDATAMDDDYSLVPIPTAAVPMVVERMTLEARWHTALAAGQAADDEPVLAADRPQYERVRAQLRDFAISSREERLARATFRRITPAASTSPDDASAWEVRWSPITNDAFEDGRLRPFRPAV